MISGRKKKMAESIWCENEPYIRKLCEYKLKSMPRYIDDCVQDVFSALVSAWQNEAKIENPRAWLTVVVNNKIKDIYELNSKEKDMFVSLEKAEIDGALIVGFETEFDVDDISDDEIEEMKNYVISQLTSVEQELFKAYYVDLMRIKEIAQAFNLSESNVKQKLYRMRKNIVYLVKKTLKQHYEQKNI